MAKDLNGLEIGVGDTVTIEFKVQSVTGDDLRIKAVTDSDWPPIVCSAGTVQLKSKAAAMSDEEQAGRAAAKREPARGDRNTGTM